MFNDGYARLGRLLSLAAIPLTIGLLPNSALADCVNPTATEGRLIYNSTSKVVQFCDGTNWIGMGGGGGGGGSSSLVGLSDVDAASAGTGNVLVYNAVSGNWESVAVGSDTQIIFNDGGTLSGNAGLVFDKTNVRVGVGVVTPTQPVDVAGLMTSDGLLLKSVAGDPPTLAGAPNLGDLADVDTSGAANGLVLKYNGTSSKWEAASDATSGGGSPLWTAAGSDIYYNSGNVGIGTASSAARLHVDAAIALGKTASPTQGYIFNPATGRNSSNLFTGDSVGTSQSSSVISWGKSTATWGGDVHLVSDSSSGAVSGAIRLFDWNGASWEQNVTILPSGNVGIGTTNPSDRLVVSSPSAADTKLRINANGDQFAGLVIENSQQNWLWQVTPSTDTPAGRLRLFRGAEIMIVLPDGKVGIGTKNPTASFEVYGGAIRIGGTTNPRLYLASSSGSVSPRVVDISGTEWRFYREGGPEGTLVQMTLSASGYLSTAGGGVWSDRRLKKDIQSLPDSRGLSSVMALEPVTYQWRDKERDTDQHLGLIAQDVEKIFPEIVRTAKDGEQIKSVDYAALTVPLIRAVQELKADNDNLREIIEAQGREIESLKAAIGH